MAALGRSGRWLVFACCGVFCALGCGPQATPGWQERLSSCPSGSEIGRISAWDKLDLRVFGEPEMTGVYEVSPLGWITFPHVGEVEVAGLRCDEVERLLRQSLGETYLRNPSVVCSNMEISRTAVTVDGQVRSPGVVDFRPGLMLTDAIAQSGGVTPRARANAMVITRKIGEGVTEAVVVPYEDIVSAKATNVCMHPGDLVYVPETVF